MKRVIAIVLALLCLTGCLAGALGEETADTPKETAFSLAGLDTTQYRSWEGHAFFESMEEITGLHVEVRQYTDQAAWSAYKAGLKAGDDMPDALFMAQLSQAELMDMVSSGVLVDLKPYLEEYCPNFMALMAKYPEYMDAITLPDGTIPALPYVNETPTQNAMWINTKFLSRARQEAPNTLEELETVLRAFKAGDMNGNGRSDDEKPLGFLGTFDLKFLAHAFGLISNDYNIYVEKGTVHFLPEEDAFYEFVLWCRDMYREGLLDPEGFSTNDNLRQVSEESSDQLYGILLTPMISNFLPAAWQEDYTILLPLEKDGQRLYRDFGAGLIRGTFAVTSHCSDIAQVLKWVDILYSEEGAALAAIGKKNRDYLEDADGTWRLTESSKSNSYYTITNVITSSVAYPGYSAESFQRRYGEQDVGGILDELKEFNTYCVRPFPYYSLTADQTNEVGLMQSELGPLVDVTMGKWILGEEELTAETFEAFKQSLKEKGLEAFKQFWQGVYDSLGE